MAIADLDQDGFPDLAVTSTNFDNVAVLLGQGDGTFAAAQTFVVGHHPSAVAIADLNQDGLPELVVLNSDSDSVSVLLHR